MLKQFANFMEFSVNEMHHISQQLKEWLRNLRKQVWLWTVNYPCIIVSAGLSTTLPQWVKVLLRAQEHRFPIVHKNWTFQEAPCREFLQKICICMLTRFNWRKNSTQQTKCIAEILLTGCWKTKKWTAIFRRKSSLAMRRTFNLMGKWTHKTVGFRARRIPRVIHEKPMHAQATVWCGLWAGGVIGLYFFENEVGNAVTLNGVRYCNMITNFCRLNWMVWIWKTCGSSRKGQPVTLRAKQPSCCEKNFLAVSSHAMAIRIDHRGRAIWHRATSFFGGLWNLMSMPTNHNNSWAQGGDSKCHWRNLATIM